MASEERFADYGQRLREAMELGPRPMSARALARELAQRFPDLRGTSYGGVRQYVEGKVQNPRVDLLRAMAEVLGVRSEWLAFGEGEVTDTAEAVAHAQLQALAKFVAEDTVEGFSDAFGPQRRGGLLSGYPYAALLHTHERLSGRVPISDIELGRAIGRALRQPFEDLQISLAAVPADVLEDYAVTMLQGLGHLHRAAIWSRRDHHDEDEG